MALLFYSLRCNHCVKLLDIVDKEKSLQSVLSFHDVNQGPIPQQLVPYVKNVPTLFTKDNKVLTGKEIFDWVKSIIPPKEEELTGMSVSYGTGLDNNEGGGDMFDLDSYSVPLAPEITPELQAKIDKNVSDAYNLASNNK